jgi:hypothetical protein
MENKRFDPLGPLAALVFELKEPPDIRNIVLSTGVTVDWKSVPLDGPHDGRPARIGKMRPYIEAAFQEIPGDERGQVAQVIAKRLIALNPGLQTDIEGRLKDIGWSISSGTLATQNAVVSEQFFPAGSEHDAYVSIRDILHQAKNSLLIVDPYLSNAILTTVKSSPLQDFVLTIRLLTSEKGLKQQPDTTLEAQKFMKQFPNSTVEIRTTAEFHDRFICIDNAEYYHVGASIKDAGVRAFVISRLQDQPVINLVKQHIETAWSNGTPPSTPTPSSLTP